MRISEYQGKAHCPFARGSRRALADAVTALVADTKALERAVLDRPMIDLVAVTQALGDALHSLASVATVAGVQLETAAKWDLEPPKGAA